MKNSPFKIFLTVLVSFLFTAIIYSLFNVLFIKENDFGYEYRLPKLSWVLDYLYEGYHYEATDLNLLITFICGLLISALIIKSKRIGF